MLPTITAILGPAEIGTFALVLSISSFVAAFSGMGSSFLLSAHYPTANAEERRGMVSALIAVSFAISCASGIATLVAWHWLSSSWETFASIPFSWVAMALVAAVIATPWGIAVDVLMLRRTARAFAIVACLQSVVTALVTVLGLYGFGLGLTSLFIANLAGAVTVGFSSLFFLRNDIGWRLDRRWLRVSLRTGALMGAGPLLQSLFVIVERWIITSSAGLSVLGLYAHSQQYRNMIEVGVKGVARSIWPITLEEARSSPPIFTKTGHVWRAVALFNIGAGLFLALFATEILEILTHGKFVSAAPFLALWVGHILLRNTGKPQIATLYAEREAQSVAYIEQITLAVGIVMMIVLVPLAGVLGAFITLFMVQLGIRASYHMRARRFGWRPFQDGWAIGGSMLVLLAVALESHLQFSLPERVVIFCIASTTLLAMSHRILRDAFAFARDAVRSI